MSTTTGATGSGAKEQKIPPYTQGRYWEALARLESWMESTDYKAYDPFDGLSSFLRPLTFGLRLPQQVLQQAVRRNPFNVRPLIGIKPHTSTKGMGFLAGGYTKLYQLTGDDAHRKKAEWAFNWLMENYSRGYSGYCWGNDFDYVSRGSRIPRGAPTIVWCGLIGHEFIEAYRVFRNPQYLEVARSVAEFILRDLPRISTSRGMCLSYVCDNEVAVHNANLLGARHLAEVYREASDSELLRVAREAARYSSSCQLENGAWYYGEEQKFHWIDNWHTAYNLDALLGVQEGTGTTEFDEVIAHGLEFYLHHFFRENGAPKYYWDRDYKYDIQSSSQSIDTLTLFGRKFNRPELLSLAEKVARWTIEHMQDTSGYFYLWKNAWFTNTTPTFHWGGTTMFHALAHLLLEVEHREH